MAVYIVVTCSRATYRNQVDEIMLTIRTSMLLSILLPTVAQGLVLIYNLMALIQAKVYSTPGFLGQLTPALLVLNN